MKLDNVIYRLKQSTNKNYLFILVMILLLFATTIFFTLKPVTTFAAATVPISMDVYVDHKDFETSQGWSKSESGNFVVSLKKTSGAGSGAIITIPYTGITVENGINYYHYSLNTPSELDSSGWTTTLKMASDTDGNGTLDNTWATKSSSEGALYDKARFNVGHSGFQWIGLSGQIPRPNPATAASSPTPSSPSVVATSPVSGYRLFPSLPCADESQPLTCFTQAVFKWAQVAIIVLAVGAIVIAGIVYMTSAGNPKQIEMSKKLILGALTGVAVMVLGRLFLTKVVGVAWPWL